MAWTAEQLLTAIRDERVCDCITEERMVMVTGLTPRQVECSAATLRRNGLIEKTGKGCHKLTDAGKEALAAGTRLRSGPKGSWNKGTRRKMGNTLRERIWRAIFIRRKFTVPEIITLVVDGTERGDPTNNVLKYIRSLTRAGYLIELKRRDPCVSPTSPGFKRWWMPDGKYTGPIAPVVRNKLTIVYDPNTEETHDIRAKKDKEVTA